MNRLGFFLLVLFFCGSVVLIASHELQLQHRRLGKGDPEAARALIRALRSDVMNEAAPGKGGFLGDHVLAARENGKVFQSQDRRKITSVLQSIVPRGGEDSEGN
jgi:hypothetical protein